MKTLPRRALLLASVVAPVSAFAHPGHDGDHDFVWTFSHLVDHPFATLFCFSLIAAGAFLAWRLATWAERPTRPTKKEASSLGSAGALARSGK